ncbi:MAG TPA: glycosyltransferase family 39 protein [Phycisphaerales bacterium]|nr:glycosyltransferase family 39 protein [Phycisphaerales bacterium]
MPEISVGKPPLWQRAWFQLTLVLVVAACIYWPMLGSSGFAFSEGQRVFPGWAFAREGDWWMPRLLDQPYLRKPPGMPWAVGAFALLFGESEYSARAVSALAVTLGGILAFAFARRWFGGVWGLIAGLAFLLTPLYWYPGRSAEIEALHNLFVQLAMLSAIDIIVNRPRTRASLLWAIPFALGLAGMATVKGPAALPALIGALTGACIAARSARGLVTGHLITGFLIALAFLAFVAGRILERSADLPEAPVLQGAEQFLWKPGRRLEVLILPASALLAALPWSAPLLLALARPQDRDTREHTLGRAVSFSVLAALAIYTVIGVYNNRYTMPITTLLPIVTAYAGWRLSRHDLPAWGQRVARHSLMHRPWVWGLALLMAALTSLVYTEHRRDVRTSGRDTGERLGELLPDGALLTGDLLMDHRPEVAWYARERAAKLRKSITVRWTPAHKNGQGQFPLPPPGSFIALLELPLDPDQPSELEQWHAAGMLAGLQQVHIDAAHKFVFRVYRVLPMERLVAKP